MPSAFNKLKTWYFHETYNYMCTYVNKYVDCRQPNRVYQINLSNIQSHKEYYIRKKFLFSVKKITRQCFSTCQKLHKGYKVCLEYVNQCTRKSGCFLRCLLPPTDFLKLLVRWSFASVSNVMYWLHHIWTVLL